MGCELLVTAQRKRPFLVSELNLGNPHEPKIMLFSKKDAVKVIRYPVSAFSAQLLVLDSL